MCGEAQMGHISDQLDKIDLKLTDMARRVDDHSGRLDRVRDELAHHKAESEMDRRRIRTTLYGTETGEFEPEAHGIVDHLRQMRHEQKQVEARTRMRVVVAGLVIPPVTAVLVWYLTFLFGTHSQGVL
jgi:hypothetical protein